ncbi:uncharacterized protein LAJ45_07380 [Morchella importuna]|uniref:uncharacterized protein n=1 Tax=Morchella importuna TaxID=1174673 RepID=UPI001E8ED929|nr:uncharacterized protein LAJ45_07380 [Morchella importuna]KAH8148669.1 hypothetical protein LAJ45_07380 [Morchella importuna]
MTTTAVGIARHWTKLFCRASPTSLFIPHLIHPIYSSLLVSIAYNYCFSLLLPGKRLIQYPSSRCSLHTPVKVTPGSPNPIRNR